MIKRPRLLLLVAVGLLVAACNAQSPGRSEQGGTTDISGWAVFDAAPAGRANQGTIVSGEFVGTDEIHFARGANNDGVDHEEYYAPGGVPEPQPTPVEDDDAYRHSTWGAFGADRAPHNGDYLLPTDTENWPDFTADLVFFRMEADQSDLYVHLRFVSFPDPHKQIATVTFSTSGLVTVVADWPRNAKIASIHSHALTIWGDGAALAEVSGAEVELSSIGGATRITDHAFEARIPLASLPAGPWRVAVGSGLADPAATDQYWDVPAANPTATSPGTDVSGTPNTNVWDLMFTPHDPLFHDDHIQANLLSSGDVTAANVVVSPAVLQARLTIDAPAITGRIAHTYESAFDFGDGITRGAPGTPNTAIPTSAAPVVPRDTAVNYEYTGKFQPYFAYIPEDYPSSSHDWPLLLYMHGLNNYIWEPFGLTLGLEDELEEHGYLFASLLGRGDLFFEGRGELDPLEVIQHMSERYRIDPQRIYLMGHSHGGAGQVNISTRHPDKFAAMAPAQIMEALENAENLRHMASIHIAGAGDPIDFGQAAQGRYEELSALGYDAQLLIYGNKTHENSSVYDTLDEYFEMYDRTVTPENPAIVIYTRSAGDFDEELGLLHDGAFWVSNMQAVDPAADMHITAESFAIPHDELDPANASRNDNQVYDSAGPSGRSAGFYSQTTPAFAAAVPVSNSASLTTRNLSAVTLDVDRMQLDFLAGNVAFDLTMENDLTLALAGNVPGTAAWQAEDSSGAVVASGQGALIELPGSAVRLVYP